MLREEIIKNLFKSKTQIKIINFFLKNSKKEFYESEIAFLTRCKRTITAFELKRLSRIGFLSKRLTRYKTFYQLNPRFVFLNQLKSIFKHWYSFVCLAGRQVNVLIVRFFEGKFKVTRNELKNFDYAIA